MTQPLNTDLLFRFYFTKLGVPYNPSPAPTLTMELPDGTVSTPSLTSVRTGEFSYTLTAANVLLAGSYIATATTTDATADFFVTQATWEVGTNDVNSIWTRTVRTITDLPAALLALFFTRNTGETYADAVAGSVVKEIASNVTASTDTSSFSGAAATEIDAITAKVNLITSSTAVTVTSPVSSAQNINLITHTDYLNADGRALSFTLSNCPSISGGSVSLNISVPGGDPNTYSGVIDSATAFHVDLTRTQTGLMIPGSFQYNIVITLPTSGDVIVPITGNVTVTAIIQ